MSRKIILRPSSSNRLEPLLKSPSNKPNSRLGEVVGGTTAECAAICCCGPCGLANFLVLAIYKVPAGLCRKALKKRREHLSRKGLLQPSLSRCSCGCDNTENQINPKCSDDLFVVQKSPELDTEALELEKEMWDIFCNTGFWRSPSQRECPGTLISTKSNLQFSSTAEKTKIDIFEVTL